MTAPSWTQAPSLRMRMSMSPQRGGFHRCTGGRPRPAAAAFAASNRSDSLVESRTAMAPK